MCHLQHWINEVQVTDKVFLFTAYAFSYEPSGTDGVNRCIQLRGIKEFVVSYFVLYMYGMMLTHHVRQKENLLHNESTDETDFRTLLVINIKQSYNNCTNSAGLISMTLLVYNREVIAFNFGWDTEITCGFPQCLHENIGLVHHLGFKILSNSSAILPFHAVPSKYW
jgi:hypothetical protein